MMANDVRPDDAQDDGIDDGMTAAAWAVIATALVLFCAFLAAMHAAGTGKGYW
jgi:hypothetical protein